MVNWGGREELRFEVEETRREGNIVWLVVYVWRGKRLAKVGHLVLGEDEAIEFVRMVGAEHERGNTA